MRRRDVYELFGVRDTEQSAAIHAGYRETALYFDK
jgi:hypothetical protein